MHLCLTTVRKLRSSKPGVLEAGVSLPFSPWIYGARPSHNLFDAAQASSPGLITMNSSQAEISIPRSPRPSRYYELFYQNSHHFVLVFQGLFILVFYLLLDKTVRNSFITCYVLKPNKLARSIGLAPVMLMSIYLCNALGTQGIQECVHALED